MYPSIFLYSICSAISAVACRSGMQRHAYTRLLCGSLPPTANEVDSLPLTPRDQYGRLTAATASRQDAQSRQGAKAQGKDL